MKPVDQTILSTTPEGNDDNGNPGNCYPACFASILETSIDQIPHFATFTGDWWIDVQAWASTKNIIVTYLDPDDTLRLDTIQEVGTILGIIGVGPSPRGPYHHAVVVDIVTEDDEEGYGMIHDPHPSREGITDLDGVEVVWTPKIDFPLPL